MAWECWRDANHEVRAHKVFGWPQCTVCRAAPPYHERPSYLPESLSLGIYVPNDNWVQVFIAPRSAVVGLPAGERVSVYYEGWVNGPMQYGDQDARGLWEAGLLHASGRMVTAYPTIAQAALPSDTLTRIGTYSPKTHEVTVENEEALSAWLSET